VTARAPISFKTALARFKAECAEVTSNAGELEPADRAHLSRWADDSRAERLWQKVQSLAWPPIGAYEPLDGFIVTILVARRMAVSAEAFNRNLEKKIARRVRRMERAVRLEEFAKTWKGAAGDHAKAALAKSRAKMYEEDAQAWCKLAQKPIPQPPFLISRVDKRGSRKQRAFMQLVGKYLVDLCGRALDSEVAVLNDIAFDTREPTSPFQARSARRPTTRPARESATVDRSKTKNIVKSKR